MSLVTTYLMGGCANQMFQYAAGYALAKKRNAQLCIDASRFEEGTGEFRMFSLDLFKGTKDATFKLKSSSDCEVQESGLPYNPNLFVGIPPEKDIWIYGYWQTEKYFYEYKEDFKRIFIPDDYWSSRSLDTYRQIKAAGPRSTFLTIRRTDYVNNSFHGVLTSHYYNTALETLASKVDPIVFVFSDEPEWCQVNLKLKYPFTVAGNFDRTVKPHLGREDVELFLMRSCQHAILANSSYSWWGAWLGNSDKYGTVIAPKRWFLSDVADPRDIVPERWIKI